MEIWIGTSGFQYPEWKGTFYPEGLAASKMLPFYATQFATTEINYSFRRIPSAKSIDAWASVTPERFKFSFKAPQKITHFAKLRNCAETLTFFWEMIAALKGRLGAVLFQLPPTFQKDAARLEAFLQVVPRHVQAAFEFRHPSWFDEQVYETLRRSNAALCVGESESITTPFVATADFGYVRLRREDYVTSDLEQWSEQVRAQTAKWREVFVYFKHEEKGVGPKFAREMTVALDRSDGH